MAKGQAVTDNIADAEDRAELERLTTMLRARTNGDDPKPGYKQNVMLLRRRIAEIQVRLSPGMTDLMVAPETIPDTLEPPEAA